MYHIRCRRGDVGRYVLMPGDPGRCALIAEQFDNPLLVAQNREYTTYTGTRLGEKVTVTSTGIGCPSTAIAVEELAMIGADTFIRVGQSGGMQPHLQIGDLVIGTAAIRDEGTSQQYMPLNFPAVANSDVGHHLGIIHSKDSFYGETQPQRMPVAAQLQDRWRAWVMGGALCSEMEAATLFVVASVLGKRAGGIMLVHDDVATSTWLSAEENKLAIGRLIDAAVAGLKILIERDRAKT